MTDAKFDIISNLPIEIGRKILMNLSPEDLANVEKCCRKWKYFTYCQNFWPEKFEQDYRFAELELSKSECYLSYVKSFSNYWKGRYNYNRNLEYNWRHGICKNIVVDNLLEAQELVYMDDDMLIVACFYEISVINISSGLIEKSFQTTRLMDWAFDESENLLTTLAFTHHGHDSTKLTIKVWNLKTNQLVLNFPKHFDSEVEFTTIHKHLIAFITSEKMLHIYNTKEERFPYKGNQTETVWFGSNAIAMQCSRGLFVIKDQKYLRPKAFICCQRMIIDHVDIEKDFLFMSCVQFDYDLDSTIFPIKASLCVWDLNTEAKLCTIENGRLADLTFLNRNILICLKWNTEEAWFECITFPGFVTQKRIETVGPIPSNYLYTSNNRFTFIKVSDDSSWKIWCPKHQKCIRNFEVTKHLKDFYCGCTDYSKYRFGKIETLIVSEKNLAYVEHIDGKNTVCILDFGPTIKN